VKTWADYRIEVPAHASGEIDTTCPECSHSRKKKRARCLSVNTDKGVWLCMHCGWSGTLAEGGNKQDVSHWRAPPRRPIELPISGVLPEVVTWFAKRGIPESVLARNGIFSVNAYMPQVESKVRCVVFNYTRSGEVINRKYRDGQKNFRLEVGCERILYGLDDLPDGGTAVIVEGEMDKLAVEVAGRTECVSVPDGAPTPTSKDYESKFAFLDADKDRIDRIGEWIIAVDDDEPGRRLEDELARRLGREKCRRARWPDGCKDANDVLVKHGGEELALCLDEAKPFPIKGIFDALDLSDRIDHLYENGWEKGVSTGWFTVDEYYTVRPGEFTVVTGIPNSGKSEWLDALIVNLAKFHGWCFGVFSPENQPLEDHAARYIEKWAGAPFAAGPTPRLTREQLDEGKRWIANHVSWILPDDDVDWTINTVLEAARALVFRRGIRGLVIDPWNELEHSRPPGMTETEYTSHVLKTARQFARRNGVHLWMVAHPAKLYRDKSGNYPVPTLYDISGSAHWRNKADNGLCVWRDFKSDEYDVEIHVQKIRFRQIGRIGMAKLRYDRVTGQYRNAA